MKRDLFFLMIMILMIIGCNNQQDISIGKMQGLYSLDKFESLDSATGIWSAEQSRIGWSGYILYDGLGHMGVHLMPNGYQDFKDDKSLDSLHDEELKTVAKTYQSNFVYFADYSIKDGIIMHKRLSTTNPKDRGTTLSRNVEFRGDTLILTPIEKINGLKLRLRWVKL
jgi:uncharacterized lipoprotein NlpE involved in copper resistance